MKLEKNELIISHAKEVEEERNSRRLLSSENEKLKFRVKCLEDDMQKQCLKVEKKSQECNATISEKNSILSILKEKEIMLDSMKRQLNEVKEELHNREQELDLTLRRNSEDDRDRGTMERKEKSRLQKELEILEHNYIELEQQRKADIMQQQTEYETLQKQHRVVHEERNIYL